MGVEMSSKRALFAGRGFLQRHILWGMAHSRIQNIVAAIALSCAVALGATISPDACARSQAKAYIDAYTLYSKLPSANTLQDLQDEAFKNANPFAAFFLGLAHDTGNGPAADASEALNYYKEVANSLPEAAFNAGRLLYLDKRVDEAMPYFVAAAGGEKGTGITAAMVMLGTIYERGESAAGKNYAAAARWYELAAKYNHPYAIGKTGEFLLFGYGRPANYREAKIYLERAADLWNPHSQFLLGQMFSQGLGVQRSMSEAAKWFLLAGHVSSDYLKRGNAHLVGITQQEYLSANRMADFWMSAHPLRKYEDILARIDTIRR